VRVLPGILPVQNAQIVVGKSSVTSGHHHLEQGIMFRPEVIVFAENIFERLNCVENQSWGIRIAGQLPFSSDAVLRGHGIKIGNRMVQCEPQVKILIDGAPVRFVEPEADRFYMASTEERRAREDKVSFTQIPEYRAEMGPEAGRVGGRTCPGNSTRVLEYDRERDAILPEHSEGAFEVTRCENASVRIDRGKIGENHPDVVEFAETCELPFQFFGTPTVIRVEKCDILSAGTFQSDVARFGGPLVHLRGDLDPVLVFLEYAARVVGRTIVDNDDLERPVGLIQNAFDGVFDIVAAVVRGDNDTNNFVIYYIA